MGGRLLNVALDAALDVALAAAVTPLWVACTAGAAAVAGTHFLTRPWAFLT